MITTRQTPILDNKYTVRTVSTVEDGQKFITTYITNNDNGVLIGGEKAKNKFSGSHEDYHTLEVLSSVGILSQHGKWEVRIPAGETTVIVK